MERADASSRFDRLIDESRDSAGIERADQTGGEFGRRIFKDPEKFKDRAALLDEPQHRRDVGRFPDFCPSNGVD
jgi:hypothetical protein